MLNKLKPKSDFSRNVLTLITGTSVAQAVPIAISPILTRLYTPEDFGVAALYLAITAIFGSIATAKYELAIMLPEDDNDALNIAALGLIISIGLAFVLLVTVICFNEYICTILNSPEISLWLFLVPFSVLFMAVFNVLQYYNNRIKKYKDLARANVYKSIAGAIVRLSVVFLKEGPAGLILGQISSQIVGNLRLLPNIVRQKELKNVVSLDRMKHFAKRYENFPKYSAPSGLANISSGQLSNILISVFWSVSTLGLYSIVGRLLGIPSMLVGSSVSQVFYQQASEEKRKTGKSNASFNSTVAKLLMIALPLFGGLFFIVEDLFAFVFGEQWRMAGQFAQILLPMYFMRFLSSPVSIVVSLFERQRQGLLINIVLLISTVGLFSIGYFLKIEFTRMLSALSALLFFEYFIFLIYYKKVVNGS